MLGPETLGIVCYHSTVYLMLTNTLLLGFPWGLHGSICAKQLEQCLAYGKDSVSK